MKECWVCKELKSKEYLVKDKSRRSGYRSLCMDCARAIYRTRRGILINRWKSYFLKKLPIPYCEICGKKLIYFSKNRFTTTSFDHRKYDLPITMPPSDWLSSHAPSDKNIAVWELCKFGILCFSCNRLLGFLRNTKEKHLSKAVEYIKEDLIVFN